jgi:DNA polymerase III sliding clamp (beta) subunit (PCNA family)
MKFNINANKLQQALQFCEPAQSKDQTRYYLNGVYFDKQPDAPLVLVATDGHRLHKIEIELEAEFLPLEFNFIMPKDAVKSIIKAINNKINEVIEFGIDGRDFALTMISTSIRGQGIDGTYPAYRRVIPNMDTPKTLEGYCVRYLIDSLKALEKVCQTKAAAVTSWGSADVHSPIVFKAENGIEGVNAIAVVMPMRV